MDAMRIRRALSIRQPYAEQILRGTKKIEYRSVPTNIRERVYIYASLSLAPDEVFERARLVPERLARGVIVGSVEVIDCKRGRTGYEWYLARPQRANRLRKPRNKPQPVWFIPF